MSVIPLLERNNRKYLIANESRRRAISQSALRVEPGVIAMGGYPQGIAGGEFFFPLDYFEKLDGHYPAFGVILEGFGWNTPMGKRSRTPCSLPGMPRSANQFPY